MHALADFLPPADALTPALTGIAREMKGSLILGIAAEVRALLASGRPVCNLTVGDFDPKQFPIPESLRQQVSVAYEGGHTNYPPAEGIPELRKAVCAWYERHLGIRITPEWVVVASGARPVMYAFHRLFLEPGERQVFAVPSWNNGYYGQLCGAESVALHTSPGDDFFPDPDALARHLVGARVFNLNSPLNPTGTVISADRLAAIARVVVAENQRRIGTGERPLMWMWDQVYWQLCFGAARHAHPCALVPEVTPYVVTVDAISKAFAATGLRVGWGVLPPVLAERMKAMIGHIGAWAPKPEQAATAALLADDSAMRAYATVFHAGIEERLGILDEALTRLGVEHLVPQGAIYLSVRFDVFGRPGLGDRPMRTNEDIRRWLLSEAGLAVVPFQAFDLEEDSGWFRMSIGATSTSDLRAAMARLGALLER